MDPTQFRLLQLIETQPVVSRRQQTRILGVRFSKTRRLRRARLDRGSAKLGHFRRSKRKIADVYERVRVFVVRRAAGFLQVRAETGSLRRDVSGSTHN